MAITPARYDFHGIRKVVYTESGQILYVRNDTLANRIWDSLEGRLFRPRTRDIFFSHFPAKPIWDMLALGQVFVRPDFDINQKLACAKFYWKTDGLDNLIATPGRTGSNWTMLTIDLALDLKHGGDGEYRMIGSAWHPNGGIRYCKLDWRKPAGIINTDLGGAMREPIYFHTHHPYFRVRAANLKRLKTVISTRSILECLESHFVKHATNPLYFDTVSLDDETTFPFDRYIDEMVEFYNSWGEGMRSMRHCMVAKYHELKADPVGTHKAIADFWQLDIPEDLIREALSRTNKSEMVSRMPADQRKKSQFVSQRKKRALLSKKLVEHILERLDQELIHTFGYDYSKDHEWGKHYD